MPPPLFVQSAKPGEVRDRRAVRSIAKLAKRVDPFTFYVFRRWTRLRFTFYAFRRWTRLRFTFYAFRRWTRLRFTLFGDRVMREINPVLVKELRGRMRGPRAFILLTS